VRFDGIVVGSGQGGNPLAHRLADAGWKVALVEKAELGGTCINTGCTPTKALVARAAVAHYARHASRWGVRAGEVSVDLPAIVAQKDRLVLDFREGQRKKVEARPTLRLVRGHARFTAPGRLEVAGEALESEKIFLDVGGRPAIPDVPGLADSGYLDNAGLLRVTELPEHLLILGGGYIGIEFAQMFCRFGSRVTVVQRGPQLLPREDPEIAAELQKTLEAEGVAFRMDAEAASVARDGAGVRVALKGPGAKEVSGSHLLVATGRRPNTDDLGLEKAGVETDARGYIRVNEKLETTAPGVWALGDVNGGPAFTHISYNDFQIVFGNLVEGRGLSTKGRVVPYCVFTDPQLGGVGMTEREARKAGKKLKIGRLPAASIARAIERDETAGLLKIVVDAADDRILGASILCAEGGELVQILVPVVRAGLPYTVLKGAVYIHPTLAEGFFGLMESVKPAD
jgi:pyruvate/2-oxoglutarate dehydrogenase complex dihydrolipoamide dehydrogenase (E3) component